MVEDRVCLVNGLSLPTKLTEWTDSLGERELDYLLSEAQRDLASDQQSFSALDSRVVATVGWAIVGVGTLLVAGSLDIDLSARGISAILVIVGALTVVAAGIYALWPRDWAAGSNWDWYVKWEVPETKTLKAQSLAALIHGASLNASVLQKRTRAFQVASTGLAFEFVALIGTLTLSSCCN